MANEPEDELTPPPINVALIAVDLAAGERYIATVCGAGTPEYRVDDALIHLNLLVYRPDDEEELTRRLAECDAAALLASHIDAVSIEQLRAAYRLLPNEYALPTAILILREPGKMEFKMSCPTCGQKLWVRDEDKGRNGRCPHCKKSFVLPAQTAHLKGVLMTPETVPLITVTDGNQGNCRGPIGSLAERARQYAQVLKSATMRVQVSDPSGETAG
jgi:DNA-directed RNA polymerase subunit RPC12/RpoP